jgi:uncharacterized membrane protein
MSIISSIPRVPALGLVAATAAGGAAMAALTPSIMPHSKQDKLILAGGGAALGAAVGGAALGALRLAKGPLGNAYGPVRTALTAAALIGSAAVVATHFSATTTEPTGSRTFTPPAGSKIINSIEEQRAQPAPPGTSAVMRDELDARGIRFVDTVMTGLQEQPVRVYAGLGMGTTPEERVQYAIDQMHALGAFDKSRIVIAQPSGSGFVNQVPIQTAEILADGDIATVALQYGDSRSFSVDSILARNVAIEQHRMLIEAVHREIEKLPEGERPELYLYGESLGGWTAQDAVTKDGVQDMEDLGIRRALWVGTPGLSHWSERVPAENAVRVTGTDDLERLSSADVDDDDRILEFRNANDAVTKLDLREIWSRPDWMEGDDRVTPDQAWIPGITFLQGALDTYNAIAASKPGEFNATAHDYRTAHAKAVQLAYDFPDVGAERLDEITDQTLQLERDYFATHPGQS